MKILTRTVNNISNSDNNKTIITIIPILVKQIKIVNNTPNQKLFGRTY